MSDNSLWLESTKVKKIQDRKRITLLKSGNHPDPLLPEVTLQKIEDQGDSPDKSTVN